jgi:hypothetical protein
MASSINYQPTIPLSGIVGNAIHEILSGIIVSTILGPCRLDSGYSLLLNLCCRGCSSHLFISFNVSHLKKQTKKRKKKEKELLKIRHVN